MCSSRVVLWVHCLAVVLVMFAGGCKVARSLASTTCTAFGGWWSGRIADWSRVPGACTLGFGWLWGFLSMLSMQPPYVAAGVSKAC